MNNLEQSKIYNRANVSDFEQLVLLQPGKNRLYTQLQSGQLDGEYDQAWLGKVQVFREKINVGARIQAAPPASLLPFSFISPQSQDVKFCQKAITQPYSIAQATGGGWDVVFRGNLLYHSMAFDRDYFYQGYQQLIQKSVPEHLLHSKTTATVPNLAVTFANKIAYALDTLKQRPELFAQANILKLMCSELLTALVDAIRPDITDNSVPKMKKRQLGVANVIDYLQAHCHELPDMQTLCAVANLSERSLQYGFNEALAMTPVQFLRALRLNGARTALQQALPNQTKVVDIATAWGFVELGRFANDYKRLFCELPSQTLQRV